MWYNSDVCCLSNVIPVSSHQVSRRQQATWRRGNVISKQWHGLMGLGDPLGYRCEARGGVGVLNGQRVQESYDAGFHFQRAGESPLQAEVTKVTRFSGSEGGEDLHMCFTANDNS